MKKYILTEEQVKRVIDGVVTEQSASDLIYKGRNIKQELGYEKEPDETPVPYRRDWWKPIQNISKDKFQRYGDNSGVYFDTPGDKYWAEFEPKGKFFFEPRSAADTTNIYGKWVPNKEGGVTVTMKDGRILTYTPQGGRSPVSITGGKTQSITPTVKTLNDILGGKGYLAMGMKGPVVGELQKVMLQLNLKISKTGKVDNIFGPIMNLSVRQFQGNNMSQTIDGKVGKITLKRMIEIRDYDGSTNQVDTPADVKYLKTPIKMDLGQVPQMPKNTKGSSSGETSAAQTPAATSDTTTTQPKQKLVLTPKQ
jgi:peptidoglycan hydrolase-like protein with peptidoglycan-binding domain